VPKSADNYTIISIPCPLDIFNHLGVPPNFYTCYQGFSKLKKDNKHCATDFFFVFDNEESTVFIIRRENSYKWVEYCSSFALFSVLRTFFSLPNNQVIKINRLSFNM